MKVRIVQYDPNPWIISKFAQRLRDELTALSVSVDIGRTSDDSADINHHLVYIDLLREARPSDSLMVTHVDDMESLQLLRRQLGAGATGICMSSDTMHRLGRLGLPSQRLCYVLPAHDGRIRPRPLLIGITTRLYDDGRKRERLILELAERIRPDDFCFVIMGSGWDTIVAAMRSRGFSVEYFPDFEPSLYEETIRRLDYYLYPAEDEGSMGFIDAVTAAVPTITTPQGFHLDAAGGLTHPFSSFEELVNVFDGIAGGRRATSQAVADWTWSAYARKHLEIWQSIVSGTALPGPGGGDGVSSFGTADGPGSLLGRTAVVGGLLRVSMVRKLRRIAKRVRRLG